jgi:hypothetical protein
MCTDNHSEYSHFSSVPPQGITRQVIKVAIYRMFCTYTSLVTYDTHGSLLQPGEAIAPLYSTSSPYSSAVRVGFRYNTPSFTKLKIQDNECLCVCVCVSK